MLAFTEMTVRIATKAEELIKLLKAMRASGLGVSTVSKKH